MPKLWRISIRRRMISTRHVTRSLAKFQSPLGKSQVPSTFYGFLCANWRFPLCMWRFLVGKLPPLMGKWRFPPSYQVFLWWNWWFPLGIWRFYFESYNPLWESHNVIQQWRISVSKNSWLSVGIWRLSVGKLRPLWASDHFPLAMKALFQGTDDLHPVRSFKDSTKFFITFLQLWTYLQGFCYLLNHF